MKRTLFTFASGLSLLLCAATVVLWVRSYYRWECIYFNRIEILPDGQKRAISRTVSTCPSVVYVGWSSRPPDSGGYLDSNQPGLHFLGFNIQTASTPLWAFATWDSGFLRQYLRWNALRLAWWDTGQRADPALGPISSGGRRRGRILVLPDWLLILFFGLLPSLWFHGFRANRRRLRRGTNHLCIRCGYDLRATPEDQSRYPLNYASRFTADRGH